MMKIYEYEKLARRTLNKNGNDMNNFKLGMIGELGEIADVIKKHKFQGHELNKEKLKEEIGDFMWYYVKYIKSKIGGDFSNAKFISLECNFKDFKNNEINLNELINSIFCLSSNMHFLICEFADKDVLNLIKNSGFSLSEVLEYNIEKLNKRYPDGFTQERSVNREK